MTKSRVKISIVITLTGSMKCMEECLQSISKQFLDREKEEIQIILVQGRNIESYKSKCNQWLKENQLDGIYIESDKEKVQEAKLDAISKVKGIYTTFFYDTTVLQNKALDTVFQFIEKREYKDPLVTVSLKKNKKVKQYFFQKYNDRFSFNCIDIKKDQHYLLRSLLGVFIKTEVLEKKLKNFKTKWDETLLLTSILAEENCYPILQTAQINYVHDEIEFINIQENADKTEVYQEIYNKYYEPLLQLAERNIIISEYIYNLILTDIALKITKKQRPACLDTKKKYEDFIVIIEKTLNQIDDKVIKAQPAALLNANYKYYIIDTIKYKRPHQWSCAYQANDVIVFDQESDVVTYAKFAKVFLNSIKIDKGTLHLKGTIGTILLNEMYKLYLCYGEKKIQIQPISDKKNDIYSLGENIHATFSFEVTVSFANEFVFTENIGISIWFQLEMGTTKIRPTINVTKLIEEQKFRYEQTLYIIDKDIIVHRKSKEIILWKMEKKKMEELEQEQFYQWKKQISEKKLNDFKDSNAVRKNRLLFYKYEKKLGKKDIYLIGINRVLPKQLIKKLNKSGKVILVVKNKEHQKQIGKRNTVIMGSQEHCIYTMLAKRMISFGCEKEQLNPFGADRIFYNGIIKCKVEEQ